MVVVVGVVDVGVGDVNVEVVVGDVVAEALTYVVQSCVHW